MTVPIDRRRFLVALPALVAAPRLLAQAGATGIRVNGLSQLTLSVSDPKRSLDFYQGLFGMPVQARQETKTLLRIGAGPRFLAIVPAAAGTAPGIRSFGMGVEQFDVDRVLQILAQHGVTPADPADTTSPSGGPLKVRVTPRGNTREMFVGDPSGIVFQLHEVSYCGGSGPLGSTCQVEASPSKGLLALKDMSHFTINARESGTAEFYQKAFGLGVQAYQATTPAYAVGPGVHFLMFTGGGGGGRGGAPAVSRIDHACMSLDNFNLDAIIKTLADYGIKASENSGRSGGPLTSWVSVRTEARGGAPVTGTPELYFSDPDGLSIQLQDTKYCGGGGYLGDVCPG